jgi:DMSO reductase family type II enzyme chaperone
MDEEQSLARALIYRFIAAGYRYPEGAVPSAMDGARQAVSEALAVLHDSSDQRLSEHQGRMVHVAKKSTSAELEQEYVSLFSHSIQGLCPLYGAEYAESDERLQQPHELSDLLAFYRAFGLKLNEGIHERVDFISVQSDFMAFLCAKQAYAQEQKDAALAEIAVDAQQKFLHDHLGRWAPALARRMIDHSNDDSFYNALGHFTLAYVIGDCQLLGVKPGKEHLKLRLPLSEEDACLNCPMASENAEADSELTSPSEVL